MLLRKGEKNPCFVLFDDVLGWPQLSEARPLGTDEMGLDGDVGSDSRLKPHAIPSTWKTTT